MKKKVEHQCCGCCKLRKGSKCKYEDNITHLSGWCSGWRKDKSRPCFARPLSE